MTDGPVFLTRPGGITVFEADVTERFVQTGGPGGQHVNKVASGVSLRVEIDNATGLPDRVKTGLQRIAPHLMTTDGALRIDARKHRSQDRNRADARDRLAALLDEANRPPPPKRIATKPSRGAKERRLKAKTIRKGVKAGRRPVRHDD